MPCGSVVRRVEPPPRWLRTQTTYSHRRTRSEGEGGSSGAGELKCPCRWCDSGPGQTSEKVKKEQLALLLERIDQPPALTPPAPEVSAAPGELPAPDLPERRAMVAGSCRCLAARREAP